MQRYVLSYYTGDGFTWSSEILLPVEADSMEEIYVGICDLIAEYADWQVRLETANKKIQPARDQSMDQLQAVMEEYGVLRREFYDHRFDLNGTDLSGMLEDIRDPEEVEIMLLDDWFDRNKG